MSNVITKTEMLEQFGDVQLRFDLFFNNYFIYHGTSKDKKDVMVMIHVDSVRELNPNNHLTINHFEHIIKDELNISNQYIRIKVTDGVTNIFQTMDS